MAQKLSKSQQMSQSLVLKVSIIKDVFSRVFIYHQYDSDEYWRKRASSKSLFWHNIYYNKCFRVKEFEIIHQLIRKYDIEKGDVLDVGCGWGEVSKFLVNIGFKHVDAVDFPEMINVAKKMNPHPQITYIASAAQSYLVDKKYDLIISSGTFSMIREIPKMLTAINNCIIMTKEGGYILMIDPFHNSNLLARAKISTEKIIAYVEKKGLKLLERSGMLFWPIRILICNDTSLTEYQTRILFNVGESMLSKLGKNIWSDYKILLFRKELR